MKQALKALIHEMEYVLSCINADKVPFDGDDFHEALRLGKEALAQPEQDADRFCDANCTWSDHHPDCKYGKPEQEPFGYLLDGVFYEVMQFHFQGGAWEGQIPVYTTPPQRTWIGLTEEDMDWLHANTPCIEGNYGYRFIRAIEAKLKEKNT